MSRSKQVIGALMPFGIQTVFYSLNPGIALCSSLGILGNTTVNWTDFNFSMTFKSLAESRGPP